MSAYQCSAEHIAFICSVYKAVYDARKTDYMTFVMRSDLYDILSKANADSVACRYREPVATYAKAPGFPSVDVATIDANIGAIFRSIACLEYQSCEPEGWKESNACHLLQSLRGALLSRLPGADQDDAWGLPKMRPAVSAPVASLCASPAPECIPGLVARPANVSRCAAEIACNPDEPKRWQLPVWRVAKGREDCRATGDHALIYALTSPAACA